MPGDSETDATETDAQRLQRELEELLQELRTVIPGAQVLFAFLLTVAFTERFERLSDIDRDVYFGVFLVSALSLVLLLAPTAFHRVRFRQHDKEAMLRLANREAIAAMVLTSFAIAGSIYLVGRLAVNVPAAVVAAAAVWVFSVVVWWLVPLNRRRADGSHRDERGS